MDLLVNFQISIKIYLFCVVQLRHKFANLTSVVKREAMEDYMQYLIFPASLFINLDYINMP